MLVQSDRAVQELEQENNELLSENLNRRRQQLFRQEMGNRLKSKIYSSLHSSSIKYRHRQDTHSVDSRPFLASVLIYAM